ncbi:MFS transporter [Arhodomonas aquaeolei]|uniref:MFS transporter n=1 Tax=Arhodomonas aquaeolei TaxID=2369 RepID=UPI002166DE6F|nr:MFS transporter [Arhodomonas aquaeolei]MCS4503395.1 MFS transporter [Arhodomonas aquaeolei]
MDYLRFILENRRFLGFGFLLAVLSGYGQTYLISLFGGEIRETLNLSNGGFGGVYSTATLISGFSLIWLGRLLDRVDLRVFSAAVLVGAALGCLLMAGVNHVLVLGVALLLLRLCGQGLMMHTAQTTMARYFHERRGTAISVATLGLPTGEAVFPAVVVAAIAILGWRQTWLAMALLLLAVVLPLAMWLLRGHGRRQEAQEAVERERAAAGSDGDWSRRQMLHDPRFYGVLPAVLAPPFTMTALFIHQVPLASEKGWPLAWLASSFLAFGSCHVLSLLVAGPLVDRAGGQRLLPVYLAPLAVALLVLIGVDALWGAPLYLACAGLSMGVGGTLLGALWVELYGTRHLGAIRALIQSFMVLSTALAPGFVGMLLDAGLAMTDVVAGLLAWVVAASLLAAVAVHAGRR